MLASTAVYFLLGFMLPRQPFLELIRIVMAAAALIAAISFSADAWQSVTSEEKHPTDSLVVGVFLQHTSLFWIAFWLLMYRLSGPIGERSEWMLNTLSFGFLGGWLSSIASLLHVWAPGVLRKTDPEAEIPSARLRAVGLAAALGVFGILWVLAAQPNARDIIERIRPWVP